MTATTTTREAEGYLAEVRAHLMDLGEDERAELLEDLAQHLDDVTSDLGNADSELRVLLGDPANYAAELRAAAGLPPNTGSPPEVRAASIIRKTAALWDHPRSLAVRKIGKELAPAWWVLRALLAVGLVVASSEDRWRHIPIPQIYGSRLLGLFVIGVTVAVSVAAGRAGYRGWRRGTLLGDVVVAVGTFLLVLQALTMGYLGAGLQPESVVYMDTPPSALESPYGVVTNIFPYDAQGRPLEGVLLYDQDGRPLRVARQEWWPDGCERAPLHPQAADGVPVEFSYPYRYGVTGQPDVGATHACLPEIPRPKVPVPVFAPAPPAAGAAPAEGAAPPAP